MLPGSKGRPACKADNLTTICGQIAYKMWGPRSLTTSWVPNLWTLLYRYLYGAHFAGLLHIQNIKSADTGILWQTEGQSFGDHLISWSVSVTPSSVIEASTVLCSVSLWLVWVNVQSACTLSTRYNYFYVYCEILFLVIYLRNVMKKEHVWKCIVTFISD
jgi:hypothetical protein